MRKASNRNRTRTPFQSRAEVETYVSGVTIECLECGQVMRSLAKHLAVKHQMTSHDYRDKWAIPRNVGLCGSETSAAHRARTLKLRSEGVIPPRTCDPKTLAEARNQPKHPQPAWVMEEHKVRLAELLESRLASTPRPERWTNRTKANEYALAKWHEAHGNPQPLADFRKRHGARTYRTKRSGPQLNKPS